jgi:hypothetical protein
MMLDDPPTADRAEDLLALLDALPAWRLFCDARDRIVDFWHPEGREAPLPLSDWSQRFLAEAIPPPAMALLLDAVQRCRAGGAITINRASTPLRQGLPGAVRRLAAVGGERVEWPRRRPAPAP